MKKYKIFIGLVVALGTATGCLKNKNLEHPDFETKAVYFPYQYPVRTVLLGEDLFIDNTLDNQHKVEIKATLSGTRDNKNDVTVKLTVDPSLLNNLKFNSGEPIQLLPPNYYSLASDQIFFAKGSILAGVQMQLTDAFFADPLAIKRNYILPLKMTSVQNADSILAGKNFILYAIKYVNQYHGDYLRRGVDVMTNGATTRNVVRHAEFVERDQVKAVRTTALNQVEIPVEFRDAKNNSFSCTLIVTFDNTGKCTVSTNTSKFTATGTGSFVSKGDKNSWGSRDRDVLYLDYQLSYTGVSVGTPVELINGTIATKDTLVVRDRAVKFETFTPAAK